MSTLPIRYHCRHVHAAGHRCGSPALRGESFCFYHHTTRLPAKRRPATTPTFELPLLEDRTALQLAITDVLNRIAGATLDPKRASLLLYGLQIAATNLPRPALPSPQLETVDEVDLTEGLDPHHPLAPEQQFQNPTRERTLEEILVEQWEEEKAYQAEEAAARLDQNTLPLIQATATPDFNPLRSPTPPVPKTRTSSHLSTSQFPMEDATHESSPPQPHTSSLSLASFAQTFATFALKLLPVPPVRKPAGDHSIRA